MKEKLRAIIGMLVTIFILGMAVNLLGVPDKNASLAHNIFSAILLALHIFVAIGILVVGAQLLRLSKTFPRRQAVQLGRAFGATIVAFLAGVTTMLVSSPWSEIASFIMAIGFVAALVLYGIVSQNTTVAKQ